MRGKKLLIALEILKKSALTAGEFIEAFHALMPRYGASLGSVLSGWEREQRRRILARLNNDKQPFKKKDLQISRGAIYDLLYRLREDKLIEEISEKNLIELSSRGIIKFKELKKQQSSYRPFNEYPVVKDGLVRIVSFDIPEHKRVKRAWLRGALKQLEFSLRKQSCWIGTTKLPKEFMADLVELKLMQYVDILEVSKKGTLTEIA